MVPVDQEGLCQLRIRRRDQDAGQAGQFRLPVPVSEEKEQGLGLPGRGGHGRSQVVRRPVRRGSQEVVYFAQSRSSSVARRR